MLASCARTGTSTGKGAAKKRQPRCSLRSVVGCVVASKKRMDREEI